MRSAEKRQDPEDHRKLAHQKSHPVMGASGNKALASGDAIVGKPIAPFNGGGGQGHPDVQKHDGHMRHPRERDATENNAAGRGRVSPGEFAPQPFIDGSEPWPAPSSEGSSTEPRMGRDVRTISIGRRHVSHARLPTPHMIRSPPLAVARNRGPLQRFSHYMIDGSPDACFDPCCATVEWPSERRSPGIQNIMTERCNNYAGYHRHNHTCCNLMASDSVRCDVCSNMLSGPTSVVDTSDISLGGDAMQGERQLFPKGIGSNGRRSAASASVPPWPALSPEELPQTPAGGTEHSCASVSGTRLMRQGP